VWDEQCWDAIGVRQLQSCREAGLLAQLVIYVNWMAVRTVWRGDFAAAASLVAEAEAIAAATGTRFAPYGAVVLAGFRGAEAEAAPLVEAVITADRAAGQGIAIQWSQVVSAVLHNGLGRYETALAQAQQASEQVTVPPDTPTHPIEPGPAQWPGRSRVRPRLPARILNASEAFMPG
jgi:hypothetical protein